MVTFLRHQKMVIIFELEKRFARSWFEPFDAELLISGKYMVAITSNDASLFGITLYLVM